ncbi:MAG: hypothetical protein ACI9U2_001935 [Bradymonadia bacterium]|jgi:hypothetical protein
MKRIATTCIHGANLPRLEARENHHPSTSTTWTTHVIHGAAITSAEALNTEDPAVSPDAPTLDPAYYWTNLRVVLDIVLATQSHVFGHAERAQLLQWLDLPDAAQQLYARLLQRRGPNFRRASLRYPEIDGIDAAIEALHLAGFVDARPALSPTEQISLFTVPELRAIAPEPPPRRLRRDALVRWLLEFDEAEVARRLARADGIVQRRAAPLFSRAQVLFFGNRRQDLSTFARVGIEQLRYAAYPVDRAHPLFANRADFDAYLAAGQRWDAAFEARIAKNDPLLVSLGAAAAIDLVDRTECRGWRERVDPARADSRVVYRAARAHERLGQPTSAIALYRLLVETCRHSPTAAHAGDRLGLLMHRAGDTLGFEATLAPLLADPRLSAPSQRQLRRRLRLMRLGPDPRADDPPISVRTFHFEQVGHTGPKALYALPNGTTGTVEEAVLHALGDDGVWCEGSLYSLLFALLCWDIIFAPLPGAFQHPFQDGPVDFGTAGFHARRAALFDVRFAELAGVDLGQRVGAAWDEYVGLACSGVAWGRFEKARVVRAAADLGVGLIHLLRRLALHPGRHRSGLPDLLVWPRGEDGPVLIEVKGPGDQMSVEQTLWHSWLRRHAVPICVARVSRA